MNRVEFGCSCHTVISGSCSWLTGVEPDVVSYPIFKCSLYSGRRVYTIHTILTILIQELFSPATEWHHQLTYDLLSCLKVTACITVSVNAEHTAMFFIQLCKIALVIHSYSCIKVHKTQNCVHYLHKVIKNECDLTSENHSQHHGQWITSNTSHQRSVRGPGKCAVNETTMNSTFYQK